MTKKTRSWLLRADAIWLGLAACGGLWMDISGAFFGTGPSGEALRAVPDAAIGFVEAHGLAFWQLFVTTNTVPMGWLTTGFHFAFALLQLLAAMSIEAMSRVPSTHRDRLLQ